MEEIIQRLSPFYTSPLKAITQLVDIFLVSFLIYRILRLVRGTRAWRILGGIIIFVAALFLSEYFQLYTLHWLLDKATVLAPVALVILLLPELRQALEGFARLGLWPEKIAGSHLKTNAATIEEIIRAVEAMSTERVGAILVLEKSARLDEIAATGIALHSKINGPVLQSIFYYGNPLHDGAVIIREDEIVAAACRLPLSENPQLDSRIHMRHRAGVGITESTDSISIIVSEETGAISVAKDGRLRRIKNSQELREFLNEEIRGIVSETKPISPKRRLRRKMTKGPQNEPQAKP